MHRRFKVFFVTSSTCLVTMLLIGTMLGSSAGQQDTYRNLAVYSEVISRIKSDYVEEPNMKNVTLGALNGLLESIDPFASYLNAEQYKQYQKAQGQAKADVGLIISKRFGYVGVVNSIPGSAAAKAGLSTGDVLETIKGIGTRDMPLAFAEMLLRGDPNTTVEVTVLRARRTPDPEKLTLTRGVLKLPPVTSKMLPDGIGLIEVRSAAPEQVRQVAKAVEDLSKQGAKHLILDLRDSATGGPEDGVQLANLFLDKGTITYLQGQKVSRRDFVADANTTVSRLPMVVLVNRGTANGAEIAAAALLDNKRAEVVGERSYGDAAVRRPVAMGDGSAVILSVAKFHSPSGKVIQDVAVTPSVPVVSALPLPTEDEEAPEETPVDPSQKPEDDAVLKKAIEVLKHGVKPAAAPAPIARRQAPPAADAQPPAPGLAAPQH
jgi:carboxyl-terminal processing protease